MTEITYLSYLIITIAMTTWVARTLSRNGLVFLIDGMGGNQALAKSVNHLLVVGFYLINIGYVSVALKLYLRPTDLASAIEVLSGKVGGVLLVLGFMHFFNMFVISYMRRRAIEHRKLDAAATTSG